MKVLVCRPRNRVSTTDLERRLKVAKSTLAAAGFDVVEQVGVRHPTVPAAPVVLCFSLLPMRDWALQYASQNPDSRIYIVTGALSVWPERDSLSVPANVKVWTLKDGVIEDAPLINRFKQLADELQQNA